MVLSSMLVGSLGVFFGLLFRTLLSVVGFYCMKASESETVSSRTPLGISLLFTIQKTPEEPGYGSVSGSVCW